MGKDEFVESGSFGVDPEAMKRKLKDNERKLKMGMEAEPLHLKYKFRSSSVELVRTAIKTKLWRGEPEEGVDKLRDLNEELSEEYGVPTCRLAYAPGYSSYISSHKLIVLGSANLTRFLYQFALHLLHRGVRHSTNHAEYAKAYSLGLFYKATPDLFDEAWKRGRLEYLS